MRDDILLPESKQTLIFYQKDNNISVKYTINPARHQRQTIYLFISVRNILTETFDFFKVKTTTQC